MGNTRWTEEQLRAITERNCNILVAAAAGSGKTAVLVERILEIVCDALNPIDIDRLLVLTFTNAAASQMRERINKAINKRIEKNPDNLHLQRQLTLINRAQITTIDSFCLRLVKENYMHVNLDPSFRIADEKECDLIKKDVLEELFEEKYSKEDSDFLLLIESFAEDTGDKRLKDLILGVYDFSQKNPFPKQWLKQSCENYKPEKYKDFKDTKWGKVVSENTVLRLEEFIKKLNIAVAFSETEGGPKSYIDTLLLDLEEMDKLLGFAQKDLDKVKEELDTFKFSTLGRKKKDDDEVIVQRVKVLRDTVKKGIEDLKQEYYFAFGYEMMEMHNNVYPVIKALTELVDEFSIQFTNAKKDKLLVDFNDIEHYALEILLEEGSTIENPIPSLVAKNMQKRFYQVMTDEYQDSNMVQEMLLYAVSSNDEKAGNRFMVGDVKQSIYRFRQAEPSIFMEKYENYKSFGNDIKIDLSKNFRSRKNVLDSVNLIFSQVMNPKIGEITYDHKSALYAGASFPDAERVDHDLVELSIINRKDVVERFDDEDDEEVDTAVLEMSYVAKRITEMMDSGFKIYDEKEGYRNLKFSDIVILFRSTPNWANAASQVLMESGIPSIAPTQNPYFDNTEVMLIVNMLRLVDNLRQDIPIMAVLKSPIYALDDDQLLQIRLCSKETDFVECITEYIKSGDSKEIKSKLTRFLEDIKRWKEISVYTPVNELLWLIYSETGYFDYVGVKRLGKRRQANLRLLVQKAEILEKTNLKGVFNFLRYVEKLTQFSSDNTDAFIPDESNDLVRIMTIHKSKGLEFPIVFVCGLGKNFNLMDLSQRVLMHQKEGIAVENIDLEKRVRYNTISKSLIKEQIKNETLSEELRVLYVAMTRAKEKLILTASVRDLEKSCLKWSNYITNDQLQLSAYDMGKVTSFIDWIVPSIVRHKSGEGILDYAGLFYLGKLEEIYNHPSKWQVNLVQKNEVIQWRSNRDVLIINKSTDEKNTVEKEIINNLLNYSYIYGEISVLPANVSVSEIKNNHQILEEEFTELLPSETEFKKPEFLTKIKKDLKLSGAKKGILIHYIMDKLDLRKDYSLTELETFVYDIYANNIINEEEYKFINVGKIKKFFDSILGRELRTADRIYKEESFAMELTPYEVYGKEELKNVNEGILIHGIIDCFYIKGEEIVLYDYKTDYVEDGTGMELVKKYSIQMEIYEKAIKRIIGKEVTRKYIYSFYLDKAIEI